MAYWQQNQLHRFSCWWQFTLAYISQAYPSWWCHHQKHRHQFTSETFSNSSWISCAASETTYDSSYMLHSSRHLHQKYFVFWFDLSCPCSQQTSDWFRSKGTQLSRRGIPQLAFPQRWSYGQERRFSNWSSYLCLSDKFIYLTRICL